MLKHELAQCLLLMFYVKNGFHYNIILSSSDISLGCDHQTGMSCHCKAHIPR